MSTLISGVALASVVVGVIAITTESILLMGVWVVLIAIAVALFWEAFL